jgi:hypothetical protein
VELVLGQLSVVSGQLSVISGQWLVVRSFVVRLSSGGLVTAMPPDVRRWLRPAITLYQLNGLCPWFGLRPNGAHAPGSRG